MFFRREAAEKIFKLFVYVFRAKRENFFKALFKNLSTFHQTFKKTLHLHRDTLYRYLNEGCPQLEHRYRYAIMFWGPPIQMVVLHGMGMSQAAIQRKLNGGSVP